MGERIAREAEAARQQALADAKKAAEKAAIEARIQRVKEEEERLRKNAEMERQLEAERKAKVCDVMWVRGPWSVFVGVVFWGLVGWVSMEWAWVSRSACVLDVLVRRRQRPRQRPSKRRAWRRRQPRPSGSRKRRPRASRLRCVRRLVLELSVGVVAFSRRRHAPYQKDAEDKARREREAAEAKKREEEEAARIKAQVRGRLCVLGRGAVGVVRLVCACDRRGWCAHTHVHPLCSCFLEQKDAEEKARKEKEAAEAKRKQEEEAARIKAQVRKRPAMGT